MCIWYDKATLHLLHWSKEVGAWVPMDDWMEGKDTFPGYEAPVVIPVRAGRREVVRARWGLIPPWAKEPSFGRKNAYNARSETLLEKPTFRIPFQKRRCVIPATAFYERANGRWVRFAAANDDVLSLAGLYEPPNEHSDLPTFTMVTTEPNDQVRSVQDRMPVILSKPDVELWLDPTATPMDLRPLLTPCPESWTKTEDAGPISRRREAPPTGSLFDL